jgi:predicted RNase H-like HicB family nuclease
MAAPEMKIRYSVRAFTRYDARAHVFVARCPAIDVITQGETEAEAAEAVEFAVVRTLEFMYLQGTLNRALLERGLVPHDPRVAVGANDATDSSGATPWSEKAFDIEVPVELVRRSAASSAPTWLS